MLLAIDTCGALGGVALGELAAGHRSQDRDDSSDVGQVGERSRLWFREMAGRSYSENLLATVDEVLREAEAGLGDLQGVVGVHGPGSFTGIRIGVSAAKGLAEGLSIPLIALSRLELLARRSVGASALAVLDAGRGEFFAGFYRDGICETEALLTRDALSQAVAGCGLPVVTCEQGVFSALGDLSPTNVAAPTAVDALAAGRERFRAGPFDNVATVEANYLRRSESEMLARVAGHAARKAQVSAIAE
jgi:tRNA threonylcarbamoyladenosine biosynthesis protein TsaB